MPGFRVMLLVGVVLVFAFAGLRPIMDTSEARYAEAAREMADENHWLVPHVDHRPHLTKPPLAYWLAAAPIKVFGRSEFAVRSLVGVFFLLNIWLTYSLGRAMLGENVGRCAGWLHLLAVFPLFAANVFTTDTFLAAFETAMVFCVWCALTSKDRWKSWRLAVWVCAALCFLTKGPPGLLPLIPVAAFLLIYRGTYSWRRLWSLGGFALFLLLNVWWFVAVACTVPDAIHVWVTEAFVKTVIESERNMPSIVYVAIILFGALPGSILLVRVARRFWKSRFSQDPVGVFLVLWLCIPFVIFCFAKTRLPLYMLPLFPPVAILCGRELAEYARSARRWTAAAFVCAVAILIGKPAFLVVYTSQQSGKNFKPLAMAIKRDADSRNEKPRLIVTVAKEGYGLLFYLGGPPIVRARVEDEAGGSRHLEMILKALAEPQPPGMRDYVMTEADERRKLELIPHLVEPLYANSKWIVWRRK